MSSPRKSQVFGLGGRRYTLRGGELLDAQNNLVPLRAKSARMIAVLLGNPGEIFSKDDLARDVWPGLIATDESVSQCISDIRRTLNDQAHSIVETFPKRGYRINADFLENLPNLEQSVVSIKPGRVFGLIIGMAMLVVVLLLIRTFWPSNGVIEPANLPSEAIAVLPFESINGREEDLYLGVGLADDLIIQLSDLSDLRVVPGVRSFALSPSSSNPEDAAASLNARYLVYGKIEHNQNRDTLQVTVQLIDSREAINIWAGEYDLKRNDLLTYHEAVLGNLTQAMSLALSDRDKRRISARETNSTNAFEEVLKGRAARSEFTAEANYRAERHLRAAIELDPNYARAYAQLAATFAVRLENSWSILTEADEEKAMFFARKAIELDPELWLAQYAIGRIYSTVADSDLPLAERHLRIAMSLDPVNDDARIYFAAVKNFAGNAEEALTIINSVLATHPSPPFWYFLSHGYALFHLEQHEAAADALGKCLEKMPTSPYCLRIQIANFGMMGELDDAQWAVEEYTILGHTPSIDAITGLALDRHPENLKRLRLGLSAAGLE